MPPAARWAAIASSSPARLAPPRPHPGLVEQPERSWAGEQAGQRGAPLLARGEETGGRAREVLEAERSQRLADRGRLPGERAREADVLGDGQQGLDRVGVPDEMQPPPMLGRGCGDLLVTPAQPAGRRARNPARSRRRVDLPLLLGPRTRQRVAGLEAELERLEHQPAAATQARSAAAKAARGGEASTLVVDDLAVVRQVPVPPARPPPAGR